MKALALITALACATAYAEPAPAEDAPRTVDVASGTVWKPGDDVPIVVGSGCFLREDVCLKAGQELAELRAENEALQAPDSSTATIAIVVTAIAVLAAGGGYVAGRLTR